MAAAACGLALPRRATGHEEALGQVQDTHFTRASAPDRRPARCAAFCLSLSPFRIIRQNALTYARVRVRAWLATGVFTSWPFGGLPYPPRA